MSSETATGGAPKAEVDSITDEDLKSLHHFIDAVSRGDGGQGTNLCRPMPERALCPGCSKAIRSVVQVYPRGTAGQRLDVAIHASATEGICVISNQAETNGFAERLGKAIRAAATSGILKCRATRVVLKR